MLGFLTDFKFHEIFIFMLLEFLSSSLDYPPCFGQAESIGEEANRKQVRGVGGTFLWSATIVYWIFMGHIESTPREHHEASLEGGKHRP